MFVLTSRGWIRVCCRADRSREGSTDDFSRRVAERSFAPKIARDFFTRCFALFFFIRASKPTRRKLRSSLLSDRCPIRRLAQFLLAYHLSHVLFFSRYITFSSSLRRDARPSSRESSFHARILRIIRIHGVYCVLRVCPYMSFLVTLREFTCVHAY